MINLGAKGNLGWFKRVIFVEMNVEEKDASSVRTARGTHDRGGPFVQTVSFGTGRAIAGRVEGYFSQFFLNSRLNEIKDIQLVDNYGTSQRIVLLIPPGGRGLGSGTQSSRDFNGGISDNRSGRDTIDTWYDSAL